jgi:DNA topoisomerase VI subunit B
MTSISNMESKRIHEILETNVKVIQQNKQRPRDLEQKADCLEKVVQAIVQKSSHLVPKNNEQINRVEMKLMRGAMHIVHNHYIHDDWVLVDGS